MTLSGLLYGSKIKHQIRTTALNKSFNYSIKIENAFSVFEAEGSKCLILTA